MEQLYIYEIIEATKGKLISGDSNKKIDNISTDSRNKNKNSLSLFVPIKGEKFDGHDFIDKAIENGSIAFLKDKDNCYNNYDNKEIICIEVEDTLRAYQDIALYYREKFNIPIIGITGSVGKTSTKEMISKVLSEKYNILKTYGNLNGQIGVPATLLNMERTNDIGIIEMGISKFDEMDRLTEIANIDHAVITNVGVTHIENLGTKENILKEKLKITNNFDNSNILFVNYDNEHLKEMASKLNCSVISFGIDDINCDYKADNIRYECGKTLFDVKIYGNIETIEISSIGKYNVYNALVSIAISCKFGLTIEEIKKGILSYKNPPMRQNIYVINDINIIDDTYNSNPDSMKSSVDVLCEVAKNNRKVVISADMLELGDQSKDLHFDIGSYMKENNIDISITYGEYSRYIYEGFGEGKEKYHFTDQMELNKELKSILKPNDFVLIKGSRGMHMENIVNYILNKEN